MKTQKMEQGADRALGSNLYCAESVLLGAAEGLNVESPFIPRIATGFCSGLSRTCGTCGAVNGGIMALGLIFGRDDGETPPDATYEKIQVFLKRFEETYGSCNCRELTGCDLSTEEGHRQYLDKGMWERCQDLTRKAVSLVAEVAEGEDRPASE